MAKFMIQASYTNEGLKGLQKDKASGRRDAIAKAMESIGGRLETMYYCLGQDDVVVIVDAPDVASVTALCVSVGATGLVRTRTTPLLTVEETDRALAKSASYRAPGR
jgi:uncharacterized protein with GYD domain